MNNKLTAKQLKEIVAFHNKVVSGKIRTGNRTRIITDPEEIAKIEPPGILSEYVIKFKRPRPNGDERQDD